MKEDGCHVQSLERFACVFLGTIAAPPMTVSWCKHAWLLYISQSQLEWHGNYYCCKKSVSFNFPVYEATIMQIGHSLANSYKSSNQIGSVSVEHLLCNAVWTVYDFPEIPEKLISEHIPNKYGMPGWDNLEIAFASFLTSFIELKFGWSSLTATGSPL